jgi:ribokinase
MYQKEQSAAMTQQQWDIIVVGGAYTDFVVRGPHLPVPGETVMGHDFLTLPGGKGSNQAVTAARLGVKRLAMVARIGSDRRGDEIIEAFKQEGVDTRYIARDTRTASGISLIQVEEHGQKQMMFSFGAGQQLTEADISPVADAIRTAKVLMLQLEIPAKPLLAAARLAHAAGVPIIFDPAPPLDTPEELLPLVTIIKPDAKEAEKLTSQAVHDRETARKAAKMLLQRGVQVVAIQAGDEGDLLVWQEQEVWLPRLPVNSIDATGAGDAFAGALAVALVEQRSLEDAGHFANAAAAITTTRLGARTALPRRKEVQDLLAHLSTAS